MKKLWFMLAMIVGILASCSDGGEEEPITPTPKPEEVKTEITIDSSIISNGLSFGAMESEQSVSFSVNVDWTLSIASTTSGATWCKASATSGSKGTVNVKFTVDENTDYEDRSVSVTIKAGSVSKTFTITQKGADALLVTTTKYEVAQEGGQIEIEVKANISYQMEISEDAKNWITEAESKGRALTTTKHKLDIAMNEDAEKREGEITFKSSDKVETVKVYQAGGAILLLSQNEFNVSDKGDLISVDIKSNIDFGVQMPDVDWISDEASSRGMSSHTLKYVIVANETYDSRSAEIVFYDKNSDLKDTLKVMQAQKNKSRIPYLTFTADEKQSFTMSKAVESLEYSINESEEWKELSTNTIDFGGELGKLRIRGKSPIGTAFNDNDYSYIIFGNNKKVSCTGDIRTLIDYENYENTETINSRFCGLFKGCSSLITAPKLLITELADWCYSRMFEGCTSLVTAPELPATTLVDYCYYKMFYNCLKLTISPKLTAKNLVSNCYNEMFCYCTQLCSITMLATNVNATDCLKNWVQSVAATGTFTKANEMESLQSGTSGIPSGWTIKNIEQENENGIQGMPNEEW